MVWRAEARVNKVALASIAKPVTVVEAKAATFRDFLSGRYGSLDALNAGWRLGMPGRPPKFEAWAQLPTGAGRGAWTRLAEVQRDLSDWKGAQRPVDTSDRAATARSFGSRGRPASRSS